MNTSSYFRLRHSRSMKMLSRKRPLPSMLMATPCSASTPVNGELAALIGVEDLGPTMADQGVLSAFGAKLQHLGDQERWRTSTSCGFAPKTDRTLNPRGCMLCQGQADERRRPCGEPSDRPAPVLEHARGDACGSPAGSRPPKSRTPTTRL